MRLGFEGWDWVCMRLWDYMYFWSRYWTSHGDSFSHVGTSVDIPEYRGVV